MDHASLFRQLRQEAGLWKSRKAKDQRAEVGQWFERLGWRQIGVGMFAQVYRRPGEDLVIKIFPLVGSAGEATLAYLKSCRRSKNPVMPRVDAVTTVGRVGIAVMEYLATARESATVQAVSVDVEAYFRSRTRRSRRLDREDLSGQALRAEGRYFQVGDLARLVSTLRTLRSQTPGARIDLNAGNLMVRRVPGGHQLVVTDPLA